MKKSISIIAFFTSIIVIVVLLLYHYSSRSARLAEFNKNCTQMKSTTFASQRSHGVILRNNTIASIRLAEEKNFSPPGGHIEVNESPKQALVRELKEELSLEVSPDNLELYKTYCEVIGSTKTQRTYIFFVKKWKNVISVGPSDQLKWVDYSFTLDNTADSELVNTLKYLKKDKLIH